MQQPLFLLHFTKIINYEFCKVASLKRTIVRDFHRDDDQTPGVKFINLCVFIIGIINIGGIFNFKEKDA